MIVAHGHLDRVVSFSGVDVDGDGALGAALGGITDPSREVAL